MSGVTTYSEAVDTIFAQFRTAWIDGRVLALIGYDTAILWQGVENPSKPDGSKFWVRVSQQTVLERQSTLSTDSGTAGQKRYTTSGLVFVQLFCPKSNARAMELGRKLAKIARDAYRGNADTVWFRNARINELPPENDCYRFNIVSEYEFDEIS